MSRVTGDFESDLDEFLNTSEFAETGSYSVNGAAATSIKGIYDAEGQFVNMGTGEVESSVPRFTCKTSDVESASNKDTLVVDSITYYVIKVEHDGTGMSVLYLSKRAPHG